ncbi:MAG: adenosylcobinamide-GDP ribazoletransferase [Fimbriiglobus sp.]
MNTLHAFLTAVQFLTRVPVPGGMNRPNADPKLLREAVIFYPLVGGIIGGLSGCVMALSSVFWPIPVAVLLGLIFEAMLTGAFHEDAVADTCDAFGGGWTKDDVLRIMKDSRVGSFGALGLGLFVALRFAGMLNFSGGGLIAVSMAAGAFGRFAILPIMYLVPPVPNRDGLSKDVGEMITRRMVVIGGLLTLPSLVVLLVWKPFAIPLAILGSGILLAWWGWVCVKRIGGITGDCLGFGCYVAQLVLILMAAAR